MLPKNPDVPINYSIIIPAHNEEEVIGDCIRGIQNQNIPREQYEIIVVNNGSTDHTAEIVKQYPDVLLLEEPIRSVGAARRLGFQVAKGAILISTDADTLHPPMWLNRIGIYLKTHPEVIAMSAGYMFYDRSKLINGLIYIIEPICVGLSWLLARGRTPLTGNNMAIRQTAYAQTAGFQTDLYFGEDLNLAHQLSEVGPVRWLLHGFRVQTSSRRYKSINKSLFKYILNFLSMSARGKAWRNQLDSVR